MKKSIDDRFWAKVHKSDAPNGCWEWIGCRNHKNYGDIRALNERYAYRVSWVMAYGPIPSGLSVCHKCDNPPCVRPDHLFIGTTADNQKDSVAKGRHRNANKRFCPRGHPYSGANLLEEFRANRGWKHRECRECRRLRQRKFLAARSRAGKEG